MEHTMVKIEDVEEEDDDLWLLDSARALEPQVKKKKLEEKEEDEDGCSLPGTFALGDRGNRLGTFLSWKDSLSACRYRCTGCEGDGKIFESKAEFAAHALLRHESQHIQPVTVPPGMQTLACLICNKQVPLSARRMQLHLATQHVGVGLEEYFESHLRGGGGPTNSENLKRCCVPVQKLTGFEVRRMTKSVHPRKTRRAVKPRTLHRHLPKLQKIPTSNDKEEERLKKEVPVVPEACQGLILPPTAVPRDKVTLKVASLCLFQCPICLRVYSKLIGLHRHLKIKKCLGPKHRPHSFRAEFCIEARYHMCVICANRVLCDKLSILYHAYHTHHLTTKEYIKQTEEAEASLSAEDTFGREAKIEKISILKEKVPAFPKQLSRPSSLRDDQVTQAVENLCVYQCPQCLCNFEGIHGLRKHLRKVHGDKKLTRVHWREYLTEVRYHRCPKCSKTVTCTRLDIGRHVCVAKDRGSGGKRTDEEIRQLKAKVPSFPAPIAEPSSLQDHEVTNAVENLCAYQCSHCYSSYSETTGLLRHLRKAHSKAKEKVIWASYLSEVRYHRCQRCSKTMACTKMVIKNHTCSSGSAPAESSKDKSDYNGEIMEEQQPATYLAENRCSLKCPRCTKTYPGGKSLKKHLEKRHGENIPGEGYAALEEYLSSKTYFRCYRCSETMLCMVEAIKLHWTQKHKKEVTLKRYREEAKAKEEEKERRKESKQE